MNQKFRLSNYVLVTQKSGSLFSLYSTRTGKHAIIDLTEYPVCHVLLAKKSFSRDELDTPIIQSLIEEEFVVEERSDEITRLKNRRSEALRTDYGLRLAILPTRSCNFACSYCFQEQNREDDSLSRETEDNLVGFSRRILTTLSKGPLVVMWFGGEPLLRLESIRKLSKRFIDLAAELGVKYQSSLITNGYFLNFLTPDVIRELELSLIQVTIDGPRDIHNHRRPLRNGGGTFDRIIENLSSVSSYFPSITIRINVDHSNYLHVPHLLSYLKDSGITDRCHFYAAYVRSDTGSCSSNSCSTISPKESATVDGFVYQAAKKLGIESQEQKRYPEPWPLVCSAQIRYAYAVDPDGNLYKCLNDAPIKERAIFNINDKVPLNAQRAKNLKASSPFDKKGCEPCKYLPVCNGGCPSANIDQQTPRYNCSHLKYTLLNRLANYVEDYRSSIADHAQHHD